VRTQKSFFLSRKLVINFIKEYDFHERQQKSFADGMRAVLVCAVEKGVALSLFDGTAE
jgi:hypothetical protein